jgi:hypothetical protein|tara:strand:+ start:1401 stop:1874 length:474 start_codon:yes stop_codon:yes gene_type:complete
MAKERRYVNGTIGDQSTEALLARHKTKLSSESIGRKSKYTRRRAIECKIVERSKSNPGYCKYMITIAEMDGTVHKQPAYGKDMQDALSRLMSKEKFVKVEHSLQNGWPFLAWMILMGVPSYFMEKTGSPLYLLYGFLGVGVMIGMMAWWHRYINKGE